MKYKLYHIQLISTEDMETVEISRMSASHEHLIREVNAVAKNYNLHGYDIDKIRIFDTDKKLVMSYDL